MTEPYSDQESYVHSYKYISLNKKHRQPGQRGPWGQEELSRSQGLELRGGGESVYMTQRDRHKQSHPLCKLTNMGTSSYAQMHYPPYTQINRDERHKIKITNTLPEVLLMHKLRNRALPGHPQHAHIHRNTLLSGQAGAGNAESPPRSSAQRSQSHVPSPVKEGEGPAAASQLSPWHCGD